MRAQTKLPVLIEIKGVGGWLVAHQAVEWPRLDALVVPAMNVTVGRYRRAGSSVSKNGNRSTVDDTRAVTGKEEHNFRNVFDFGPFGKIGVGHGLAVRLGVDDAGQDGVGANTGADEVGGERVDEAAAAALVDVYADAPAA